MDLVEMKLLIENKIERVRADKQERFVCSYSRGVYTLGRNGIFTKLPQF